MSNISAPWGAVLLASSPLAGCTDSETTLFAFLILIPAVVAIAWWARGHVPSPARPSAQIDLDRGLVLLPGGGDLGKAEVAAVRLDSNIELLAVRTEDFTNYKRRHSWSVSLLRKEKPDSAVTVASSRDQVAMFDLALQLAERWQLPLLDRGHPDNEPQLSPDALRQPLSQRPIALPSEAPPQPGGTTEETHDGRLRLKLHAEPPIELDASQLRLGDQGAVALSSLRILRLALVAEEGDVDGPNDAVVLRKTVLWAIGDRRVSIELYDHKARWLLWRLRVALSPPAAT